MHEGGMWKLCQEFVCAYAHLVKVSFIEENLLM